MKFGRLLPAVLLGAVRAAAWGQIGVYLNPIATRASNAQPDNGSFAFLGAGNTAATRGGVSLGGYYMFAHGKRLNFGVDARDEWQGGNDSLLNSFLVGVRASGTVGERLHPYVQVSGGAGTTRAPLTVVRTTKAMAKGYVGLDYNINRHLDFRVIEIGYGELTTTSDALYNSTLNYSADRLL